jgi:hypothetical protein
VVIPVGRWFISPFGWSHILDTKKKKKLVCLFPFLRGCKVIQDKGPIDDIVDYWVEEFSSITKIAVLAGLTFLLNVQKVERLLFHMKPFFGIKACHFLLSNH